MKYGNKRTTIDGETYASRREAKRHADLLILQRAGRITNLRREVPFVLAPAVKIAHKPLAGEPIITSATIVTIAAPFVDRRFVPDGPVSSVVDSAECRPWAKAAA